MALKKKLSKRRALVFLLLLVRRVVKITLVVQISLVLGG